MNDFWVGFLVAGMIGVFVFILLMATSNGKIDFLTKKSIETGCAYYDAKTGILKWKNNDK